MRWAIEIDDIGGDRRLVEEVLAAIGIQLTREDSQVLMVSPQFEQLDTGGAVRELALKVRDTLKAIASLRSPPLEMGLELGRIVRENVEGGDVRRHRFIELRSTVMVLSTGRVEITRGGSWTEEDRLKAEAELKEREFQRKRTAAVAHVRAGLKDGRVLEVLRLLHGEVSIQNLNHVVEIIQADLGRTIQELVSKNQLTRFTRSINHPKVFGFEARHAVIRAKPPSEPMSKQEATEFVRQLADRWIARKAATSDP